MVTKPINPYFSQQNILNFSVALYFSSLSSMDDVFMQKKKIFFIYAKLQDNHSDVVNEIFLK